MGRSGATVALLSSPGFVGMSGLVAQPLQAVSPIRTPVTVLRAYPENPDNLPPS